MAAPYGAATNTAYSAAFLLWVLAEAGIFAATWRRAGNRSGDRGSYLAIVIGVFAAITISFDLPGLNPVLLPPGWSWVGIGLMVAGIALRVWAVATLGRYFSLRVTIQSDHRLVERGPYRFLRHPAYAGSLLTLLGVPLGDREPVGALLVLAIGLLAFGYRMRLEERALLGNLGDEYRAYMGRTWRVIPWVW